MTHLDLFSGIGSWTLAAQHVWGDDYECLGFCEIDWFCRMVLTKHFPGVPIYGDIKALTDTSSAGLEGSNWQESPLAVYRGRADLLSASPPCQSVSTAGRRRGKADNRWLWPQTLAAIRIIEPTWCILENVYGLLSLESGLVFEELCFELESIGYKTQSFVVPAVALGAPHRRDRLWLVAHSLSPRARSTTGTSSDEGRTTVPDRTDSLRQQERPSREGWPEPAAWQRDWREVATSTCSASLDDGIAGRLVRFSDGSGISYARWRREALKAIGNSICPQVAIEIMKAIKAADGFSTE